MIGQEADGIAKLVDAVGNTGIIEYFYSPSGPRLETREVPLRELRRVELKTQTRVFRLDPVSGAWSVGRVDGGLVSGAALGKKEDHYHVRFPNEHDERVAISELFVRRASPVEDPTEYLASMITDTPFFFDGRVRIVRHLADQRRLFGGMTGLASSAIELLEHQVSVARKVLSDPIQRYLLADEVGLGKTIEAGILIRQHLLDHPDEANILVVVPDHLVLQWKRELRAKFYIHGDDERVRVIALSTVQASAIVGAEVSLLLVDEAHVSAAWAFAADPELNAVYLRIRDIARLSPRVLLLSGTPVLYREKEFLAMLHLLDPEGYRLSEVESFHKRISERQTVADALVDLGDDANGIFVEDAIVRIEAAFSNDAQTIQLCEAVRKELWDDASSPSRTKVLRELRNHIHESYKLDRRILRTRRVDPRLRDRLPNRSGATIIDCHDMARIECADFLEAWRLSIDDLSKPTNVSVRLFGEFATAALDHPRHLLEKLKQRITLLQSMSLRDDGDPYSDSTPVFDGEKELLEEWLTRIVFRLDVDGRSLDLVQWLKGAAAKRKYILFVSDKDVADIVAQTIRAGETPFDVIRYHGRSAELRAFEQSALSVIFVCDRTAEEGLNLQRAGAVIIHYDLPLDALRIEQRIGRVDRIEGRGNVSNVILVADTAYERAWAECVTDGVGVFDHSIAALQFLLSMEGSALVTGLLPDGASAFSDMTLRLQDPRVGALAELKRIDAQEAIDSVEAAGEQDAGFFQRLLDADERIAEIGKRSLDAWLVTRLGFDYQSLAPDIGRYVHNLYRTLVPWEEAFKYFAQSLDQTSGEQRRRHEMPLLASTFHRDVAEIRQVPLLRIGNALVDALEQFVRDDPRGMAFGIWRTAPAHVGEPSAHFRFDFYIETNLDRAILSSGKPYSLAALRRRADALFPVQYETIWLDSDMELVVQKQTLEMVQRSFSKEARPDGSFDANLSHLRWQEAMEKLERSDWAGLCATLRVVAEERLKESADYANRQKLAIKRLDQLKEKRASIHNTRIGMLRDGASNTEKELMVVDIELDELLTRGIVEPSIRVDSVGCVIIASEALEAM